MENGNKEFVKQVGFKPRAKEWRSRIEAIDDEWWINIGRDVTSIQEVSQVREYRGRETGMRLTEKSSTASSRDNTGEAHRKKWSVIRNEDDVHATASDNDEIKSEWCEYNRDELCRYERWVVLRTLWQEIVFNTLLFWDNEDSGWGQVWLRPKS